MKIHSSLPAAVALACSVSLLATAGASAHNMSVIPGQSTAPASDIQKIDHRGRGLALGIGAAVGAAIILSEAARADGHRRYERSSYCGRLLYRCEDGSEWSCHRYEDRCR